MQASSSSHTQTHPTRPPFLRNNTVPLYVRTSLSDNQSASPQDAQPPLTAQIQSSCMKIFLCLLSLIHWLTRSSHPTYLSLSLNSTCSPPLVHITQLQGKVYSRTKLWVPLHPRNRPSRRCATPTGSFHPPLRFQLVRALLNPTILIFHLSLPLPPLRWPPWLNYKPLLAPVSYPVIMYRLPCRLRRAHIIQVPLPVLFLLQP